MWHEKEVRGGDYPYTGGWVSQPLDLLIQFQAMTLMYSAKMNRARLNSGKASQDERAELESNITQLQRDMIEWAESE